MSKSDYYRYNHQKTASMIKRTLYFSSAAYLKTRNEQLVIELQETGEIKTAPIEDIGLVILDHQQITVTQSVIARLLANNTAFITCDANHHPTGLMLNLDGTVVHRWFIGGSSVIRR